MNVKNHKSSGGGTSKQITHEKVPTDETSLSAGGKDSRNDRPPANRSREKRHYRNGIGDDYRSASDRSKSGQSRDEKDFHRCGEQCCGSQMMQDENSRDGGSRDGSGRDGGC